MPYARLLAMAALSFLSMIASQQSKSIK